MALSDAGMDKALAELLGWRDLVWCPEGKQVLHADMRVHRYKGWYGTDPEGYPDMPMQLRLATDALAARRVIAEMQRRGYGISLVQMPGGAWSCTFFDTIGKGRPTCMEADELEARAIGKAALCAVREAEGLEGLHQRSGVDW